MPAANIVIERAKTDAPEAADTVLCFRAGLAAAAKGSTRYVIVCGTERRYPELVAQLKARGAAATIVRFKDDPVRFVAEIKAAAT